MSIRVNAAKSLYEAPDLIVIRVKGVGAMAMNHDPGFLVAVSVAMSCNVVALLKNIASAPRFSQDTRQDRS